MNRLASLFLEDGDTLPSVEALPNVFEGSSKPKRSKAETACTVAVRLEPIRVETNRLEDPRRQDKIAKKRSPDVPICPSLLQQKATSSTCSMMQNSEKLFDGNEEIRIATMRKPMSLAGDVLSHCLEGIQKMKLKFGDNVCVFKIGLVGQWQNLLFRWEKYRENGFARMHVLHASLILEVAELLEACCISHYQEQAGCRNIARGGEGMRRRGGQPRYAGPYILYVVAASATQRKAIKS